MKLLEAGILTGKDGTLSEENRTRILEEFGFENYENSQDLSALHRTKAGEENLRLKSEDVSPDVYDDHVLHVAEHVRFLLSEEFKKIESGELKQRYVSHIAEHKKMLREQEAEKNQ